MKPKKSTTHHPPAKRSTPSRAKLETITYYIKNKPQKIKVKLCNTILSKTAGLMFRNQSPPLLFTFNKTKTLAIHSLFCKPFKAIWLDEKMRATKITDVKNWKLNISGKGKYLLEIPASEKQAKGLNRKSN